MQASPETLRAIGESLEELTFFTLRRGKPQKVSFTGSGLEEAEPVIDGLALEHDIPVQDVIVVAGLVRAFEKSGRKFTEFYDLAADLHADGRLVPLIKVMEPNFDAGQAG